MRSMLFIFLGFPMLSLAYYQDDYSLLALIFVFVSTMPLWITFDKFPMTALSGNNRPPIAITTLLLFLAGLLNNSMLLNQAGVTLFEFFSLEGLTKATSFYTGNRYSMTESKSGNPILLALSLCFIVYSAFRTGKWANLLVFLAFINVLFYSLLTTEKWPLFLGIAFYLSAIFVIKGDRDFPRFLLKLAIFSSPLVVILIIALFLIRGIVSGFFEAFAGYVFLQYSAFGYKLTSADPEYLFGGSSFVGVFNALGLSERTPGVWGDELVINEGTTNIYTVWYYFYNDFGVLGGVLPVMTFVLLIYLLRALRLSWLLPALYFFGIFSSLISFNLTPFVHNTTVLALFLSAGGIAYMVRGSRNL